MDAEPVLRLVARVLATHRLEAVLIGNAAAALQGSLVTTLDLDFMFRKTSTNMRKLKAVADDLGAVVMRPFYPTSDLYRLVRDRDACDGAVKAHALSPQANSVSRLCALTDSKVRFCGGRMQVLSRRSGAVA